MIDEKMILGYAKSLRDEYIATATDYGLDHQMTKILLRDYRAIRRMWNDLTDRNLSDDIERLLDGDYD